jgi:predicted O-methyltransferase YrrM
MSNYKTLQINYNSNKSELCEIGKVFDTDKSSQRNDVTDIRHCHPYTLFYESLFKGNRHEILNIAELGILKGGSLLMLREYFTKSQLYGFEFNLNLIESFKNTFNNDRITLKDVNVTSKDSIAKSFSELNILYDIIIEDTTHQFEDQIRVIENTYKYLKPGGIMIIEDIFKKYNENAYRERLKPILHHFSSFYFVELDHKRKISTGWDNDKLLVLVKAGADEIFKNKSKISIITPSYRVNNLLQLKNSINFEYVDEWIIVYDGKQISQNPYLFKDDEKIKEYICRDEGISGNPQRNLALSKIKNKDTIVYFLDDDNIIHPNLYSLLNIVDNTKIYTFNQSNRLSGNNITIRKIDTAMFLIPFELCKNIKWQVDKYEADFFFIHDCYKNNTDRHVFVNNDLCFYNKISK